MPEMLLHAMTEGYLQDEKSAPPPVCNTAPFCLIVLRLIGLCKKRLHVMERRADFHDLQAWQEQLERNAGSAITQYTQNETLDFH